MISAIRSSRFMTAIVTLLLCTGLHAEQEKASPPTKPNVLFLISDDLNSWILGDQARYSGKVVAPNLLKLANSGVNFMRAYTVSPVCSPSRTAYFSGVAPWNSGHYHNALEVKSSEALNNAISLAGTFKKAGYGTYGYGKITHGWDQKEGWDHKIGHKRDPYPPNGPLTKTGKGEQDWGPIHIPEEEMNSTLMANHAIAKLKEQHDKPFFLACGFFNPHMPWYVPQKYFDMFPMDEIKLPPLKADDLDDIPELGKAITSGKSKYFQTVQEAGLHKSAVQAYLATTAYVDVHMGRVLDALAASPYADNTIVVFFTDHGFHLGEKSHWQKATLWEEATHTLMMWRVPEGLRGATKPQGKSERFVSLQDLYPTLVDLCGLEKPDYLDGRSLLPLLKDPNAEWESTAYTGLCNKASPDTAYLSLRNEVGRYIRYNSEQEEFYIAANDPHEWKNEISNPEFAEALAKIKAKMPTLEEAAKPLQPVKRGNKDKKSKKAKKTKK